MKGSDKISLKLHSFRFGGMVYEVSTAYVETKGKGEGKKTAARSGAAPASARSSAGLPAAGQGPRSARLSAAPAGPPSRAGAKNT